MIIMQNNFTINNGSKIVLKRLKLEKFIKENCRALVSPLKVENSFGTMHRYVSKNF